MSDQVESVRLTDELGAFVATYYDHWPYGGYDERICTVAANTESEALGLVLDAHPDTKGKLWNVERIKLDSLRVETLRTGGT